MPLIGRKREQEILSKLFTSQKSEFLAVYGRRRVGKTFLIKEYFQNRFSFYVTGIAKGSRSGYKDQLRHFAEALNEYGLDEKPALSDWGEAFNYLRILIGNDKHQGKKVIFIDEMPWLSTPKSGFVQALEYFWNSFAEGRKDILLIACGSATSWMYKMLLQNSGGLHNRVTMRMLITPFTLAECEQYYRENNIVMSRYQMAEAYMILGGIPYYLSLLNSRMGLAENIDNLFFAQGALLEGEYTALYHALFKEAGAHMAIVEALATKNKGLTQDELCSAAKITKGGRLTRALGELEQSGFIRRYKAFQKKERGAVYQLTDSFTLFHFNFILQNNEPHFWQKFSISPGHNAWSGYAFELVCLLHAEQIKKKAGAAFVLANIWAWSSEQSKPGAQIDMVIDRGDGIVDLCEMKYLNNDLSIGSAYAKSLRNKRSAFLAETKTRKSLRTVLITTYGLLQNEYSSEVQVVVTMDDLFETA
jgi:hypothetical protein